MIPALVKFVKGYAKPENSYDTAVTRNNDKLIEHFKNVYRVLLSRAHKGVYVYFIDNDTEEFFRSRIEAEAKKGEIKLKRK